MKKKAALTRGDYAKIYQIYIPLAKKKIFLHLVILPHLNTQQQL
jgi:hypothetical protein